MSIRIATVDGIPIRFHFTLIIPFLLLLTNLLNGLRRLMSYNRFATNVSSDLSDEKIRTFAEMDVGRNTHSMSENPSKLVLVGYAVQNPGAKQSIDLNDITAIFMLTQCLEVSE